MLTLIDCELHLLHGCNPARDALRALEGLHPDALHVRFDFTVAVVADAAAGTVAQSLGAVHGARHSRGTEDALTAHAAIEQQTFDGLFDACNRRFDAFITECAKQPVHAHQQRFEPRIERTQTPRVAHRPEPDGVHQAVPEAGSSADAGGV